MPLDPDIITCISSIRLIGTKLVVETRQVKIPTGIRTLKTSIEEIDLANLKPSTPEDCIAR